MNLCTPIVYNPILFRVSCVFTASQQIASAVGFSVYAEDEYQYPNSGEIIRFPLLMTNNGGHYDPINSMFTCPLNGTYYFTFSLYTSHLSDGERTAAYIEKDGEKFSEAYCGKDGPDNLYTQCSTSAVIHCHLGQRVFVKNRYSGTKLYGVANRSNFSGFLIHADVPPY